MSPCSISPKAIGPKIKKCYDLTLNRNNFETEARSPKQILFSQSWARKDSVGTSPEKFSRWKFLGTEHFIKKITFLPNSVDWRETNVTGSCALNSDATNLPHLNPNTPKFSWEAWSWPGINCFASRAFQSQVTQIRFHQNRRIWGALFQSIDFLAKQSIFA